NRASRPAAGGSGVTAIVESGRRPGGFAGWIGHVGDVLGAIPGAYRDALRTHPLRTTLLSALVILGVFYPLLNRSVLQGFSRNVFPLPIPDDTVVTFMLIFSIMAVGLNIVAGFAGLLDLGYVAFYAIGAYTAAFLASPHFGVVSIVLLANVPQGFPGIHIPFWFIVPLAMIILALGVLFARNLERSRIGRAWMAIREDELAAEMMGVHTVRTKLLAFALGASFAGIAGSLQASYLGATTSDFFQFSTSILVLIMVILGGIGNIWGVIVGAVALQYVNLTLLPYLGQQIQS